MKRVMFTLLISFFALSSFSQSTEATIATATIEDNSQVVMEVSCGKCKFGLPGKSCDLAIKIKEKAYYVDGVSIDALGDAHGHDGLCNVIRKANVEGKLVDNRFIATSVKLLPIEEKKH